MGATVIVGLQFGDEGKGKITDFFAEKADLVARFNGGNNAGHTVVVGEKKFKFFLLPSGAAHKKKCCIGAGVALDPKTMLKEITGLGEKIDLVIDARAQIVMPWHNLLDLAIEQKKDSQKIGTTGRGIGPCYADRASRSGIRFLELVDEKRLQKKISENFGPNRLLLELVFGFSPGSDFSEKKIFEEYSELGKKLKSYCGDVSLETSNAINSGKKVLLEAAQGTFLDNDFGTYPFVTSSHPIAGAALTGIGLPAKAIEKIIGVAKAYTTRVGSGPFATELNNEIGSRIREKGMEFGTTTGRPRRVGWLDLVLLRTANRLNGTGEIVMTKIDVLSGIEELNICTEYLLEGKTIREVPADTEKISKCIPVYKKFPGFEISGKEKSFAELGKNARAYVEFVEKELKTRISVVSIGAERNQTILR
ncbi:MAG: adenylosuccinate synthase [Candidatus ainarchaeum sp.]|nr:adenylosuccinate synthase [Candidatus ainarchaeum sp.]